MAEMNLRHQLDDAITWDRRRIARLAVILQDGAGELAEAEIDLLISRTATVEQELERLVAQRRQLNAATLDGSWCDPVRRLPSV